MAFNWCELTESTFKKRFATASSWRSAARKFVIADCTLQRPGVYFEAGFALALGRTLVWTCREDDFKNVHFDTRQYPHIVWTTLDDLRKSRLTDRLRAQVSAARVFDQQNRPPAGGGDPIPWPSEYKPHMESGTILDLASELPDDMVQVHIARRTELEVVRRNDFLVGETDNERS